MKRLRIATWNIHKGLSVFNGRCIVHDLRECLRTLDADIVFLQEVQGEHSGHAARHADWPTLSQHEFLAETVWTHSAYGRNVVHDAGHHGNAILSRFPIEHQHNQDVTHLRFEKRGLLHCAIRLPRLRAPLHCVCVHLSLLGPSRRRQADQLAERIAQLVPADAPLLIAGDFNDWGNQLGPHLAEALALDEAHTLLHQRPAFSFPARLPLLPLDRIYVRGLDVTHVEALTGTRWGRLSDHAALAADLVLP